MDLELELEKAYVSLGRGGLQPFLDTMKGVYICRDKENLLVWKVVVTKEFTVGDLQLFVVWLSFVLFTLFGGQRFPKILEALCFK